MILPDFPNNETKRLEALHKYGILDTSFDEKFDNLTELASQICNTKIALVSLIDENRQWFKSCVGLKLRQTSRGISFCGHAINSPLELLEIQDASQDERFFDNPLVIGEPFIRFYAGFPILDKQGLALGTLCVIDSKPKKLTNNQKSAIKSLAKQVYNLIELHSSAIKIENERQKFKRFADLSPSIIYRYSSNHSLIYHNPKVEELLGYPQIAFKNNPDLWLKLIHLEDLNRVEDAFKKAKSNQRIDLTYRIKSRHRGWLWVKDTSTSINFNEDDFVVEGVVTDITETRRYQDSLLRSNERYTNAMKASNDAIWEYHAKVDQLNLSIHFFEWLQLDKKSANISMIKFKEQIHKDDRYKFQQLLDSLIASEFKKIDVDVRVHLTNNKYRWLNIKGSNIDKEKQLIAGSITDVHQRKVNEQELLKVKSLFNQASQLAKLGTWELDIESKQLNWSKETYQIHEINEEDISNFDLAKAINFYHEADQQKLNDAVQGVISSGRGYDLTLQIKTAKGNLKWVRTLAKFEYSDLDRKNKVFGVIQDITHEVIIKEKQKHLVDKVTYQNDRLKNYAYIASHNLRSYAANFDSLLEIFATEQTQLKNNEVFKMLTQSSTHMLNTIADLQKVADIHQQEHFELVDVNLNSTLNKVIDSLYGSAKKKKVEIICKVHKGISTLGLNSYVESILFNLTSNAIKYSDPNKNSWLKITTELEDEFIKIIFEDNGIGIDLNRHKKNLFKMYKVFNEDKNARGLGLFITKSQIEAMGGSVKVESELNKGSKFVIRLKRIQ